MERGWVEPLIPLSFLTPYTCLQGLWLVSVFWPVLFLVVYHELFDKMRVMIENNCKNEASIFPADYRQRELFSAVCQSSDIF